MCNSVVCNAVAIGSNRNNRTHDGSFSTLNEIRHVPLLTKNLIFLSLLNGKGFNFHGDFCMSARVLR